MTCTPTKMPEPKAYYGLVLRYAKKVHLKLPMESRSIYEGKKHLKEILNPGVSKRPSGQIKNVMELIDIFQSGVIGLLEAIQKFNPGIKTKFSSFVTRRVWGEMIDFLRKWLPIPQGRWLKIREVIDAEEELSDRIGAMPTVEEVAQHLGISVNEAHKRKFWLFNEKAISLDEVMHNRNEGEDCRGGHELTGTTLNTDDSEREWEKLKAAARTCVKNELGDDEALIIENRWLKENRFTLKELGAILGVVESTVKKRETKCLNKLRRCLESQNWSNNDLRALLDYLA